jgi:hypothetical protein
MTPQKKIALGVGIASVVLIVLAAGTAFAYDVYVKHDDNALVRSVASALPAARVGSHVISYKDFLDARDTIAVYLKSDAAQSAGLAGPLTPSVEKSALDRLIREAVDAQLAQERHVSVSDNETMGAFAQLTASTSSSIPNVGQYLKQTFNWDEQQFRDKVIRPSLLEQKLADTFAATGSTSGATSTDGATAYDAYMQKRATDSDIIEYLKFPPDVTKGVQLGGQPQ